MIADTSRDQGDRDHAVRRGEADRILEHVDEDLDQAVLGGAHFERLGGTSKNDRDSRVLADAEAVDDSFEEGADIDARPLLL